jgi:hypothetical protein
VDVKPVAVVPVKCLDFIRRRSHVTWHHSNDWIEGGGFE